MCYHSFPTNTGIIFCEYLLQKRKRKKKSFLHLKLHTLYSQLYKWQNKNLVLTMYWLKKIPSFTVLNHYWLKEFLVDQFLAFYTSNFVPLLKPHILGAIRHAHTNASPPDQAWCHKTEWVDKMRYRSILRSHFYNQSPLHRQEKYILHLTQSKWTHNSIPL